MQHGALAPACPALILAKPPHLHVINLEKFMVLPPVSKIGVFLGTLNLVIEVGFLSLMVVKLLFSLSISKILPVMLWYGMGLLIIRIKKAAA